MESILIALVLAVIIKSFVIDTKVIPSGSMLPTIQLQDRILVNKSLYTVFGKIQRGDIVVFKPPAVVKTPKSFYFFESDLIKRVVGLPGDTLQVKDGKLFVNNKPVNEPYLDAVPNYTFGPYKVPAGKIMVFGDNRNDSYDSHYWGPLDISSVKGKAFAIYWPISHFGMLK